MSGLVTFFKARQEEIRGDDPLIKAVDAFLTGKEGDEILLFSAAEKCCRMPINTLQELIEYYRSVLSILLLRKLCETKDEKLDEKLVALIKKGKREGFGNCFELQKGYEALASYLFEEKEPELEFKQLEKGAMLQGPIPHPMQNAHMGLIALYLGSIWEDEELLQKGVKSAEFCLSLCDHNGELFQGIWIKEADYHLEVLEETLALFFKITTHFLHSSRLEIAVKTLSKLKDVDPFISLFRCAFEKLSFPTIQQKVSHFDIDRSLGFFRYEYEDMSLVVSALGFNTGMGSIHKKGVQIVSMGPHYAPLADSNYYGISRASNGSQEGFKDLKIESENDKGEIEGWTRVISSEQWLFFNLKAEKEKIDLMVRQSHHNESTPLYFVFFVSADKGIVEKEEFHPGTLNRYFGKSHNVLFEKGGESIEIIPQFDGEMKLIPLAGKKHFWSAGFLLAFSLNKKLYPYSWAVN